MKRRAWTKRDEERLRELYRGHTEKECAAILGRPSGSIKTKVCKLGLQKQRRHLWSAAELRKLRALFPDRPSTAVARLVGHPLASTQGMAHKLGLRKSAAYLAGPFKRLLSGLGNGIRHRFPKGHVPANKGLRRPGWFAGRMRDTQFKKGQRPLNTLPVGTIMPNGDGYLRIKVSDAPEPPGAKGANSPNWVFLHRAVWEAAHGPIPRGHRIWWKDRDHTNCKLENLELLTDKEHMRRTTIHNLPPHLKRTIMLNGALKRRIRRLEREKADATKQDHRPAQSSVRDHRGAERQRCSDGNRARQGYLRGRADHHQQRQGRAAVS